MLDIVPRNQLYSLSISEDDTHVLRSKLGRHEQVVDDDDSCCLSGERGPCGVWAKSGLACVDAYVVVVVDVDAAWL